MNLRAEFLKTIAKSDLGIEIGPWFNPMTPKREGYHCLSLDIFDTEKMRQRALGDPHVASKVDQLEEVDIVGSTVEIGELADRHGCAGRVDYIVSSHNFEHIPNPVKFFQGCEKTLKLGGHLNMIIPDKRTCFDYFKPPTSLGMWLEAYLYQHERPAYRHVFDGFQMMANHNGSGVFSLAEDSSQVSLNYSPIRDGYAAWKSYVESGDTSYIDAHCSILTPTLFELLLLDLNMLGLVHLKVVKISPTVGCEFAVSLENMGADWRPELTDMQHYARKTELLRQVGEDLAFNTATVHRLLDELKQRENSVSSLRKESRVTESLAEQLRSQLQAVRESRSWKITAPLRRTITAVRRTFNGQRNRV
ncbi:methyltransferase domain-containing protein [Paraburkholderia caballeronis]|uniref:Methyltransferase domain-containing protein n=1 Tax=Paraburkholderia caballeronis TaxID=416943 RepID=A0A1H7R508_9BURK|nr:hypothetical protein [Paraburkholderia caballeronis]PXW23658.1 hypothetical protein C7403_109111 [Paraburkholderia caballeronis]PXW98999.1 hypothetical protein C7407_109111 [Paraburkholderia caballeronis]RAJ96205.1 hypothetical protein C7409_109111 [Paraburkholderia caballeronis]TDV14432.1 hypothetical protein C7408_108113 [Paraburkholderia caballeronis]TDV15958.1 hypothetical protein C7406_109113 [Paraburkholderia caballeronis]